MRKQDGIATVEFAIIGLLVMVVLFGVLETGR
jgi:Flp pilus assembly protein TadG